MIKEHGTLRDKIIRWEKAEKTLFNVEYARYIIRLDSKPVLPFDITERNPLVRCTTGEYFIKYNPAGEKYKQHKYPYVLGNDLFPFFLRITGPKHLKLLRKFFPEIDWTLENTSFDTGLFEVAKAHPGMRIPFTLNFPKYYDKIIKQMNEMGINPLHNKPFVTFKFCEKEKAKAINVKQLDFLRSEYETKKIMCEADKELVQQGGEKDDL